MLTLARLLKGDAHVNVPVLEDAPAASMRLYLYPALHHPVLACFNMKVAPGAFTRHYLHHPDAPGASTHNLLHHHHHHHVFAPFMQDAPGVHTHPYLHPEACVPVLKKSRTTLVPNQKDGTLKAPSRAIPMQ
eukprot:scaffold159223_cov21-Tisochrysis_lutea.AAC.2